MTTQRHITSLWQRLYALCSLSVLFFGALSIAPAAAHAANLTTGASSKPSIGATSNAHNTFSAPVASKSLSTNVIRPAIAWTVSLTASSNDLWPGQSSTLTATANQNVGPTPYYIEIYDESTGTYVANCYTGTVCTASVTKATPTTQYYEAYVADYPPTTGTPSGIQASYGYVGVLWQGIGITLGASQSTLPLNGVDTLTATTSTNVGPTPFWTEIYDATTGTRLTYCGSGTTCSVTTSQAVATTHKFVAYVSALSSTFPPASTIDTSNPVYATWTASSYRVTLSGPTSSYGSVTLTATANTNVGPTPYYIEIYNLDTGTRLTECPTGTTCSVTTALNGTNHFAAFISSLSTSLPPLNTQATSNELTSYLRIIP
jgi:hypothetical protein